MRKTEVWDAFTPEQQIVIRFMLRLSPAEREYRSEESRELLRAYWRAHRRRSRAQLPSLDDHRVNREYRKWLRGLRAKGETVSLAYNRKTYERFRKEVQCKS